MRDSRCLVGASIIANNDFDAIEDFRYLKIRDDLVQCRTETRFLIVCRYDNADHFLIVTPHQEVSVSGHPGSSPVPKEETAGLSETAAAPQKPFCGENNNEGGEE